MAHATPVSPASVRGSQPELGLSRLTEQGRYWAVCLLLGLGLWLLARRLGGALAQPLDSTGAVAAAIVLILLAAAARWPAGKARRSASPPARAERVVRWLTTAGIFVCGAALSPPNSPPGPLALFWGILLTAEAASFAARRFHGRRLPVGFDIAGNVEANSISDKSAGNAAAWPPPALSESMGEEEEGELLPPGVSQRISRSQDEADGEIISGLVRCSFEPHERQRDIHLAFCPPLKQIPQFSAEQVEGPPARIRPSLVETFGVGLEVKLAALSSEPASVQIQFFACEEPIGEEAG
ncbi:MAG: hypothetical protein GX575_24175 [Candidatus Anammoximicrobium sp.]|nr:hypothetical protein [Candidatus Anammoximicrobium sp.]